MASPSHKMVAETFQPGLRPSRSGQHSSRFQSRSQRYLKPSWPPSSPSCTHSALLQEHPATPMECWGVPGTSAAGQAPHSQLGVLLPGTGSPQGRFCHGNVPATAMDQRHTELSHNPATALLSKPVLHAGSSPALSTAHRCTSHALPSSPSNSRAA